MLYVLRFAGGPDGKMPKTFCCTTPELLLLLLLLFWPCLTQEAKDWWKFLSCWKGTEEPSLEARTIFVPGVTWPVFWPEDAGVLGVLGVEELAVVVGREEDGVLGLGCSRRFCCAASLACLSWFSR